MAVRATPLFGRYTDAERIGAGEVGEVYRATDSLLGRPVAVKLLSPRLAEDPGVRRRFVRDTLAAAPLSAHPHVVTVYDVGERDAQAYVVMDYLARGSLEERLHREGPQPRDRVLDWLEQAAAALDAAHVKGIWHGDVKPSNLLLDAQGNVQLADFGAGGIVALAGDPAADRRAFAELAFELLGGTPSVELDTPYRTCGELVAAVRGASASAQPRTVFDTRRTGRPWLRWSIVGVLALTPLAVDRALNGAGGHHAAAARPARMPRPRAARHARRPTVTKGTGAATVTSAAAVTGDPHALNDQGYALMRRGEYSAALPLLQQAVQGLAGQTADPYDGYANYNLGYVLVKLGRCDEAVPYLRTAKQVEPARSEVDAALAAAARCSSRS
jgi:tetratricopeptide (TPR) repeat protein